MANDSYDAEPASGNAYADIPMAEAVGGGEFESSAPSTPNIGLAVLKRWPWLVVGMIGGLVLGLLYHTQRPPVFQSSGQLLVIKNRADMVTTGGSGGNTPAVAVVEDYVSTQVTVMRSQIILEIAARNLKDSQLNGKLPANEKDRVNYLMSRFAVVREREAGSAALTNILALTFRASYPSDCPICLKAIIEAYEKQLASIYEEASTQRLALLEKEMNAYKSDLNEFNKAAEKTKEELRKITQEDLINVRSRVTSNKAEQSRLKQREAVLNSHIKLIEDAGPNRQQRLIVLSALGQQIRTPTINTLESRNAVDVLFTYKLQRKEIAQKFGKDHPEMQAIDSRIRMLEELVAQQGPAETDNLKLDELAIFGLTLKRERETLLIQKAEIEADIADDESKVRQSSKFDAQMSTLSSNIDRTLKSLTEKELDLRQTQNTRTSGGFKVETLTKPADGVQVAPVLYQSILFGLVLGLAAGFALALSMEMTDRSFRSPAEIRRRLGLPILGHIPKLRLEEPAERPSVAGIEPSIVSFYRPTSTEAEAYRGVRTQLYFSTQGRGHQVIQVTSPNPGDGKSTLAANLAVSIAQSGKRVVLMDCDFRKPRIHKLFMVKKPEIGLASVMTGNTDLDDAILHTEIENLSLLPCGPRPANPAELLTTPKFQEVLQMLRERFEFVIVDTPPVLAVSDPSAVAPRVDGVMLVFRMTKNARPVAERAREQLAAVGARILGVIVNASSARSAGYGGYGYAYQYEYQYAESYTDEES